MSVQHQLVAVVRRGLLAHPPLADELAGVFDAPVTRAVTPYARIEEALLADWSTKDMVGREGRIGVTLWDAGDSPVRLRRLMAELEVAMGKLPRAIGGGWDLVNITLVRARVEAAGNGPLAGRWQASGEWRVRLLNSGE